GAAEAQKILLLLALGVRHHDHGPEAQRIADQRQPDAGIAGGAFDDGAPGAQGAALDRVLDDVEGRAVPDRTAGSHEFGLAVEYAAGHFRRPPEADQRGIADAVDEVFADLHW